METCNVKERSWCLLHSTNKGIQRSVSVCSNCITLAFPFYGCHACYLFRSIRTTFPFYMTFCNFKNIEWIFCMNPLLCKNIINFCRTKLPLQFVCISLYNSTYNRMHCLWSNNTKLCFENINCSALSTLTVNADNVVVFTANIMRVNRKIWNIPHRSFISSIPQSFIFTPCINCLTNCILM